MLFRAHIFVQQCVEYMCVLTIGISVVGCVCGPNSGGAVKTSSMGMVTLFFCQTMSVVFKRKCCVLVQDMHQDGASLFSFYVCMYQL